MSRSWDNQHIREWLESLNCGAYTRNFEGMPLVQSLAMQVLTALELDNNIVGEILLECDETALRDIGVRKVGDRIRIHQSLKTLRRKTIQTPHQRFSLALNTLDKQATSTYSVPASSNRQSANSILNQSKHLLGSQHGSGTSSPQDVYFGAGQQPRSGLKSATAYSAPKSATLTPGMAAELRPLHSQNPSPDAESGTVRGILSMDQVKQSTVKFIYSQGISKTVNIDGCFNGESIKRKALKKSGVRDLPDNWVVFIADNELGTTTRQVSDLELVTICHGMDRKERNRLILCPANGTGPSVKQLAKSQQIIRESHNLEQQMAGASSPYPHNNDNDFNDSTYKDYTDSMAKLKSPSTMDDAPKESSTKKRLRKFFGQRPPSELISHNLQEYFPEAGPAVLKETIRNSIMYKRMSRMSRISQRSSIASAWTYQDYGEAAPPLPSVDDLIPPGMHYTERPLSNASLSTTFSIPKAAAPAPAPAPQPRPRDRMSMLKNRASLNKRDSVLFMDNQQEEADEAAEELAKVSEEADVEEDNKEDPIEEEDEEDSPTAEEDFLVAFNREQSGPSRWIKGTFIGSGSFGTVYLGMNSVTGELMAVKQVEMPSGNKETEQRKQSMIDALEREMNLLRDLQHENIVQYLGSNSEGNFLNIFLEYVPGGSVATMLTNYGAFEESLIRNFVRQILNGLRYLHERSIIHRDIKGANVLVDNKGGIKISDFGISKKIEARLLTAENNRVSLQGSVYWMAPEVVKQTSYTLKADIWSLGCLIVEMFTGTHPFPEFSQMQAIFKIGTSATPTIPAECSEEAKEFLGQTFEIDFNKRPTAEELLKHPFLKPLL